MAPLPQIHSFKSKLSPNQEKDLLSLYGQGKNDYEVSKEMHIGRNRLRMWREGHGIPSRTNKKDLSPDLCVSLYKRLLEGETLTDIAKSLGVVRTSVSKLLRRNGYDYSVNYRSNPLESLNYKLSKKQISILIGDMFGDGHLTDSETDTSSYSCSHSLRQESFVVWKFNAFKPLSRRIHYGSVDDSDYLSLSTWSNKNLKEWRNSFYPHGSSIKVMSPQLAEMLDTLGLAVWFMGDGSKTRNSGCFTVGRSQDLNPVVAVLNRKFGDIFKATPYESQWTITAEDGDAFFKLIGPFIIPLFHYKIPEKFRHYCSGPSLDVGHIYGNSSFTSKSFKSLSDVDQNSLIDDVTSFYQSRGFPFPQYSEKEKLLDFEKVKSNNIRIDESLLKSSPVGSKICNHFFPHRYNSSRKSNRPMDLWEKPASFKKFIKNRLNNFSPPFSDVSIRTGLSLKGLPSNFSPLIAKYIYQKFSGGGDVLDFCSGYGGRLLGYLSSPGRSYVGVEPFSKSYSSLFKMADFICSRSSIPRESIKLIMKPFEDCSFRPSSFDLAFSSPPYFDLETYTEEETQSLSRYPSYPDWLRRFWFVSIDKCYESLKNGGHFVFSLSNPSNHDLVSDTLNYLESLNYEKLEPLRIPYFNVFRGSYKYENIYIFKKLS